MKCLCPHPFHTTSFLDNYKSEMFTGFTMVNSLLLIIQRDSQGNRCKGWSRASLSVLGLALCIVLVKSFAFQGMPQRVSLSAHLVLAPQLLTNPIQKLYRIVEPLWQSIEHFSWILSAEEDLSGLVIWTQKGLS